MNEASQSIAVTEKQVKPIAIYSLSDPRTMAVMYIGKTKWPKIRLKQHINDPCSNGLRRWIEELLEEGLVPLLDVIEWCGQSEWQECERFWISFCREQSALLNVLNGGNGNPNEVSDAIRAKISASSKSSPLVAANIERLRAFHTNRTRSKEIRERMGKARKGKTHSDSTRAKMREARKNNPRVARHMKNLADSNKGRKRSMEQRIKQREAAKNNPLTVERVAKMAAACKGIPKSAEHRAKIAAAKTGLKRSAAHTAASVAGWHKTRAAKLAAKQALSV